MTASKLATTTQGRDVCGSMRDHGLAINYPSGVGAEMTQSGTERREIRAASLAEPISHYTDAVVHGDVIYVSGCIGVDADGNLIGGDDAAAQTRQVLTNLGTVLAEVGAGFEDVLKITTFLTDIEDRARINPVRREFFGAARPASTLVEVSRLAVPGAKVEIEAVAAIPAR